MALTIKNNIKVAIMAEVSEGTLVPPASGADFIGVLEGIELSPAKELIERAVLTGSIGKPTPRTGTKTVTGTVPVEFKAGSTDGADPEYSPLINAALGAYRNKATAVTTKSSGNTSTVLQIEDADISSFAVGDIIVVKQTGAYHVSPITARSTGSGTATITMLVAHPSGDCTDSVQIAPFRTFYTANTGHATVSVSKYVDDAVTETAAGCRVSSMAMEGFATGQLPSLKFAVDGLSFTRAVAAIPYTPSVDSSLPPIVLNATVYIDGAAVAMNEVGWSVDNSLAFATSTASSNGRISGRVASRSVKGTLNPYKQTDSVAHYTKFNAGTAFSVFGFAYNPTATAGEFNQVVAFYLPNCIITELGESDQDGILQDAISFTASRGASGATEEIYVSTT